MAWEQTPLVLVSGGWQSCSPAAASQASLVRPLALMQGFEGGLKCRFSERKNGFKKKEQKKPQMEQTQGTALVSGFSTRCRPALPAYGNPAARPWAEWGSGWVWGPGAGPSTVGPQARPGSGAGPPP